jgi:hypothetical protein
LYFSRGPQQGRCPAGGQHDGSGSGPYSVFFESATLERIALSTNPIYFPGGVAAWGWSTLTVFPSGKYDFNGHFRATGALSYNVSLVWAVKSVTEKVFVFNTSGRTHGTFEPGSRDYDWNVSGTNFTIGDAWDEISIHHTATWRASVNADIGALWNTIRSTIGDIVGVVTIVGKVVG